MSREGGPQGRAGHETDTILCGIADILHDMAVAPEQREALLTMSVRALAQQHGLTPAGDTLTALSEVLESARAVALRLTQSEQDVARHSATLAALHTEVVVRAGTTDLDAAPARVEHAGRSPVVQMASALAEGSVLTALGTLTDPVTNTEYALGSVPVPHWPDVPHKDTIASALGLTQAEARLCALLAEGRSPKEAAGLLGVKLTTVRTQLRAVFQKTHTRGQADLMRYLATLPRVASTKPWSEK